VTSAAAPAAVKVYPVTYEQEAIWLDDHLSGGSSRYLESWVYRLWGQLDLDAVGWAISRVVDRHEALRSGLTDDGDSLVQTVWPSQDVPVRQRSCDIDALEGELRVIVSEPLDLDASPLRVTILELAPDQSALVVQFHHAVVDDWALDLFGQEFGELYTARTERRPAALAPPTMQLGEYALGQRSAPVDADVLGYWRERLRGAPDRSAVPPDPPDRPRPAAPSHASGQVRFRVGDEAGQLVRQVGRLHRTTPFTVLAATAIALLCGYNGTSEVILGASVSRRGDASLDGLMGCLTGVLPLRQAVRPDQSFADLITSVRSTVLGAFAHRDIPYTLVARAAGRRYAPLCQTVIVVDDAPRLRLELPGLTAERLYVPSGTSKFDLCLTLVIDGAGYQGFLDYASERYDPPTALRIVRDFQALLVAAVRDPARMIQEIR
jgi:Condensation domain